MRSIDQASPRQNIVLQCLKEHSRELNDLGGYQVGTESFPIDALQFHRNYVSRNKPCIIRGAGNHWAAVKKWTPGYLSEVFKGKDVPVAVTPNGRADAVTELPGSSELVFALPAEGMLSMASFLDQMTSSEAEPPSGSGRGNVNILYIQQQNDCLRQDFQELLDDIEPEPEWAVRLFGTSPEAVNLWVGGRNSETTFHKDHYENLFTVISGSKTFHLLPPGDVYRLAAQQYPAARYVATGNDIRTSALDLVLEDPPARVHWCPIDPNDGSKSKAYPLFFDPELPQCARVTVDAGEVLYLPSLWHHYVQQEPGPQGLCIAVNHWFDMAMDSKFAQFLLTERLAGVVSCTASPSKAVGQRSCCTNLSKRL